MNIKTQGMQMPIASKSAAQQVNATNDIALQQQMKSAGANTPVTTSDIQNLGAQTAAQRTAVNQGEQAASLGQTIDQAQRDFGSQQNAAAQQGIMDDQARANARIDAEERLASLGADVRETLLNRDLALDENNNQLQFTNERQLADLAAQMATDERDLSARLQDMQQASDMKVQAAQYAVEAYTQAQDFIMRDRELSQDMELQKMIAAEKRAAEERAREARKKAAKTGKIIGAVTATAGAAIVATSWATGGTTTAMGASMVASGVNQYNQASNS